MDFFIVLFVVFIILFGYSLFRKSSQRPFRRRRSAGPPRIYDAGELWTTTHHPTANPVSDNTANFMHHSDVDSSGSYNPGGWTATDYTNTSDASTPRPILEMALVAETPVEAGLAAVGMLVAVEISVVVETLAAAVETRGAA